MHKHSEKHVGDHHREQLGLDGVFDDLRNRCYYFRSDNGFVVMLKTKLCMLKYIQVSA